jgi:hypothetical protein
MKCYCATSPSQRVQCYKPTAPAYCLTLTTVTAALLIELSWSLKLLCTQPSVQEWNVLDWHFLFYVSGHTSICFLALMVDCKVWIFKVLNKRLNRKLWVTCNAKTAKFYIFLNFVWIIITLRKNKCHLQSQNWWKLNAQLYLESYVIKTNKKQMFAAKKLMIAAKKLMFA